MRSPRMAVVRPQDLASHEPLARKAGVSHVETLGTDGEGSLARLARDVYAPATVHDVTGQGAAGAQPAWGLQAAFGADSLAALVYTSGTTRPLQGRDADARESRLQCLCAGLSVGVHRR